MLSELVREAAAVWALEQARRRLVAEAEHALERCLQGKSLPEVNAALKLVSAKGLSRVRA